MDRTACTEPQCRYKGDLYLNFLPDIKLQNCAKTESRDIKCRETDGQTDMTTVTVAFRNCFDRQRLSTHSMDMLDKQPVPTRQRGIYT